jgi:hypothetical protein
MYRVKPAPFFEVRTPSQAGHFIKPLTYLIKLPRWGAKRRHHKRFDRKWKPLLPLTLAAMVYGH